MKNILWLFVLINCYAYNLYANLADTIVINSGKVLVGTAHHLTSKTISITTLGGGTFLNETFTIVIDSIKKIALDPKLKQTRTLLEKDGTSTSKDTIKMGLRENYVLDPIKKCYMFAINTDIINLALLNPHLSFELFRKRKNGSSLILNFTYNLKAYSGNNKYLIKGAEKVGAYTTVNYQLMRSTYSAGIGFRKYFATNKVGSFYFSPQFSYSIHDFNLNFTTQFAGYTFIYKASDEITGLALSNSFGFCFYSNHKTLVSVEIGVKALSFGKQSWLFLLNNGLELGLTF